jgi:YfiR/HmsC-like
MKCLDLLAPTPQHPNGQSSRLLIRSIVLAISAILFSNSFAQGQQAKASEYEVKAVYLFNFAKFVDWPANVTKSQPGPFTICVLGKDPFGPVLDATVADESIGGKRVVARRIAEPPEAFDCQILYISSSEEGRLNTIFGGLARMAILTVSDIPQFSQHGGMIEFVLQGNKIRFDVNLGAAQQAGLSLSSQLLKVASNVRRDARSGE